MRIENLKGIILFLMVFLSAPFLQAKGNLEKWQNIRKITQETWERMTEAEKKAFLQKAQKILKAPYRIEIDKVYIPFKDWDAFLKSHKKMISLSYQEFLKLALQYREKEGFPKEASGYRVLELQGKLEGDQIQWVLDYQIQILERGWLPLWPGEAYPVYKAFLNGKEAPIRKRIPSYKGLRPVRPVYEVYFPEKGNHILKLVMKSPWKKKGRRGEFSLSFPRAHLGRFRLDLSGHWEGKVESGVSQATLFTQPKKTVFKGAFRNRSSLKMSFQEKMPTQHKPILTSFTEQTLVIKKDEVNLKARINYASYRGPTEKIEIQIPKGFSLAKEPSLPVQKIWYVQKGKLFLYFPKGIKGRFACDLVFTSSLGQQELSFPKWKVGAMVERGKIQIYGDEDQILNLQKKGVYTLGDQGTGSKDGVFWGAFGYDASDYEIKIQAEPIKKKIHGSQRILVAWKDDRIHFKVAMIYLVTQGKLSEARIQIPKGGDFSQVNISPSANYEWLESSRELVIFPKSPLKKGKKLTLSFDYYLKPSARLVLPVFSSSTVEDTVGYIGLSTTTFAQLQSSALEGLEVISVEEGRLYGLKDPNMRLVYRFTGPYKGVFIRKTPLVKGKAKIISLVKVGEFHYQVFSQITLQIQEKPSREMVLEVPPDGVSSLEVKASAGKIEYGPQNKIHLLFEPPVIGKVGVSIAYQIKMKSPRFSIELPKMGSSLSSFGILALHVEPHIQATIHQGQDVKELDTMELPESLKKIRPYFACSYGSGQCNIALEIKKLHAFQGASYVVTSLYQESQMDKDGGLLCRAHLRFYSLGGSEVSFALPKGSELWSVTLMGKGVKPVEKGEKIVIPLGKPDSQEKTMEIVYKSNTSSPSWILQRKVELPQMDGPVLQSRQKVFIPEDFPLLAFSGTMKGDEWKANHLLVSFVQKLNQNIWPILKILALLLLLGGAIYLVYLIFQTFSWITSSLILLSVLAILIAVFVPNNLEIGSRKAMSPRPPKEDSYKKEFLGMEARKKVSKPSYQQKVWSKTKSLKNLPEGKKESKLAPNAPRPLDDSLDRSKEAGISTLRLKKSKRIAGRDKKFEEELKQGYIGRKHGRKRFRKDHKRNLPVKKPWGKGDERTSFPPVKKFSSSQKLEVLFPKQYRLKGLKSLVFTPRMEGVPYEFHKRNGTGFVEIEAYSPGLIYSLMAILGLLVFGAGMLFFWDGPRSIFYIAGLFFASLLLPSLFGNLIIPFANTLVLTGLLLCLIMLVRGGSFAIVQKGLILLLLVLLFLPQGAYGQNAGVEKRKIQKFQVFLPYNPKKRISKISRVYLPLEEYWKIRKASKEEERFLVLTQSEYLFKVQKDGTIKGKASLTFLSNQKEAAFIPLPAKGLLWTRGFVNGKESQIFIQKDIPYIYGSPGLKFSLALDFIVLPKTGQNRIHLSLPSSGVGRILLENPKGGPYFLPPTFSNLTENKARKIELPIQEGRLTLLKTSSLSTPVMTGKTKWRQILSVHLLQGINVLRSYIYLKDCKDQVTVQLSRNLKIVEIRGGQGRLEKPLSWERKKEKVRIFLPKREKRFLLQILALDIHGAKDTALEAPRVVGARMEKPTILGIFVSFPYTLKIRKSDLAFLSRWDPAVFRNQAKYTFLWKESKPIHYTLSFQKIQNLYQSQILAYIGLKESRIYGKLVLERKDFQKAIIIQYPSQWIPLDLPSGNLVEEVIRIQDGKLLVLLKNSSRFQQKTSIHLSFRSPWKGSWPFKAIRISQMEAKFNQIQIFLEKSLELENMKLKNLFAASQRYLPFSRYYQRYFPQYKALLYLEGKTAAYEGELKFRRKTPKVTAHMVTAVRVQEKELHYLGQVHLNIQDAPITAFHLQIPKVAMSSFSASYPFQKHKDLGDSWDLKISLQKECIGATSLTFSYNLPLGQKKLVPLALPRIPSHYKSKSYLSLAFVDEDLIIAKKKGWKKILELPSLFRADRKLWGDFFFELEDSQGEFQLEQKAKSKVETLAALLRFAFYSFRIDEEGAIFVHCRFQLQNQREQFLKLKKPDKVKVWTTYVEGKITKPVLQGKNELWIPIPKKQKGDLSFPVEVFYSYKTKEELSSFTSFSPPVMEVLNMPLDSSILALSLPKDYGFTLTGETNLDPLSQAEAYYLMAEGYSKEFMELSNLKDQLAGQSQQVQKIRENQIRSLKNILSNLQQAEKALEGLKKPNEKVKKVQQKIQTLKEKIHFYRSTIGNTKPKRRKKKLKLYFPLPQSNLQWNQNIQRQLNQQIVYRRRLNMDPFEYKISRHIYLAFHWKKSWIERREGPPSLPYSAISEKTFLGPKFSSLDQKAHFFHKTGGHIRWKIRIFSKRTNDFWKVLLAILASFLMLLGLCYRGLLEFRGKSIDEGAFQILLLLGVFILGCYSFRYYWLAIIIILVQTLDIIYLKKKEQEKK